MKSKKHIIFIVVACCIIILLFVLPMLSQRMILNDAGTVGNTPGNLNNKGLFCEKDGTVYFSNTYKSGVLFSMNPDETDLKQLNNVSVKSINADDRRLYYYQDGAIEGSGLGYIRKTNGVYRSKKNGKNSLCLKRDPAGILALCGNYLYYQHYTVQTGTYLDKIKIDKKDEATVLTQMTSPACVTDGTIYLAGMDGDHYLYSLDTTTDTLTPVWEHNLYNPIYVNGWIYFMDLETDYELHRYHIGSQTEETLTTDRLDFFNVYDTVIYYQRSGSSPALIRINTDGSNPEIVRDGTFESVNITSQYAYFNEFQNPIPIYHQSTFGPINVGTFDAARDAALIQK